MGWRGQWLKQAGMGGQFINSNLIIIIIINSVLIAHVLMQHNSFFRDKFLIEKQYYYKLDYCVIYIM